MTTHPSRRRQHLAAATVISLTLIGCSSSQPPPAPPPAVTLAWGLTSQAGKLSQQGNWPAAVSAWRNAADQYRLLNDLPGLASALHSLGLAQTSAGNLEEAHLTLMSASRLHDQLQRHPQWWRDEIALLQVESKAGMTNALAERFNTLTPPARTLDDPMLTGLFLSELGLFQQSQGNPDEAMNSFLQAQARFEEADYPFGIATAQANQARLQAGRNAHQEALTLWTQALQTFETLAEPEGITAAIAGQGRALLALGQETGRAHELLGRAAENYRALNRTNEENALLDLLHPTAAPQ